MLIDDRYKGQKDIIISQSMIESYDEVRKDIKWKENGSQKENYLKGESIDVYPSPETPPNQMMGEKMIIEEDENPRSPTWKGDEDSDEEINEIQGLKKKFKEY